jgi:D-glycerate 3-kinase
MLDQALQQFLAREQLPAAYAHTVREVLQPLAAALAARSAVQPGLLVGINGAQGSGKTTLTRVLSLLLQENHKQNVVTLSLDDFYLTRAERNTLAKQVHPLLRTRGVPGTHDVSLMRRTLDALTSSGPATKVSLPMFDKSTDDRAPQRDWPIAGSRPDIILFEGWCVGISAQPVEELMNPVNNLEANEDRNGRWRRFVNDALAWQYQPLFARLDLLIMLRVPSFYCVLEWRWLQERKMDNPLMDREAVQRFIQHFERLTRHSLQTLPPVADLVLSLDAEQQIRDISPDMATLLPAGSGGDD